MGHADDALKLLNALIQEDSSSARYHYQQGRLDEAIADLNRVVDKTPKFKDCVELRNRILMERNSKNEKRMKK